VAQNLTHFVRLITSSNIDQFSKKIFNFFTPPRRLLHKQAREKSPKILLW